MTTMKPSHCAFPWGEDYPGLSIREYFAALALQGLLANPAWMYEADNDLHVAESAVAYADKLIEELNGE